ACEAASAERRNQFRAAVAAVAAEVDALILAAVTLLAPPDSPPTRPNAVEVAGLGGLPSFRPAADACAEVASLIRAGLESRRRTVMAEQLLMQRDVRDAALRELDEKIAALQRRMLGLLTHSADDIAA